MAVTFLRQIKDQSSTLILSVGNQYSVRLLCDVINYSWPAK